MSTERRLRRRRRRGRRSRGEHRRAIFLLPNLITTGALLLGFWAIVQSFEGHFERAALAIVLAGICDMLDGRVARATHSTTKFGVEYDSMSDLIAFGVAPAVLVYSWTLAPLGPRGWLVASLFTVCAAMRLARFNVQQHVEKSDRYQGLPSTMAGGIVAVSVWFVHWAGAEPPFSRALGVAITLAFAVLGLLMVSTVPFLSAKSFRLSRRNTFPALVGLTVLLIVILMQPEPVMFGLGMLYLVSGPALMLYEWRRPPAEAAVVPPADAPEESTSDV